MKKLKIFAFVLVTVLISISGYAYDRDWQKFPAWVEVTGATRICAVGDVHGAFDELTSTLEALKIARKSPDHPFRFEWIGNDSVLVMTGDLCDRGLHSKQVYDAIMDLETRAKQKGGRVIALVGNHEAMLLNGQVEDWAKNLTSHKKQHYQNTLDSFTRDGLDFHEAISEKGLYGQWIRNRPLFAIVNGYMFVHGGLPNRPVTRSTLAADFQDDITRGDWKKGIFMNHDQVLWNRDWWKNDQLIQKNLKVLGIMGVAFGHTIGALSQKGKIAHKNSQLISIDVGMTPAYGNSKGGGLLITTTSNGLMIFRAVYPDRPEEILFSVRMPASAYSNANLRQRSIR
ncbi:MAG: hypothetical protein PWR01_3882 [Clostridiales bacterium]|nr:hypothetical protein [Clostridiales bacterium]MDN5282809.1 hypothetical protein [Candidatus Ozemobacter sp.]